MAVLAVEPLSRAILLGHSCRWSRSSATWAALKCRPSSHPSRTTLRNVLLLAPIHVRHCAWSYEGRAAVQRSDRWTGDLNSGDQRAGESTA